MLTATARVNHLHVGTSCRDQNRLIREAFQSPGEQLPVLVPICQSAHHFLFIPLYPTSIPLEMFISRLDHVSGASDLSE